MDGENRIFFAFAGKPDDPTFDSDVAEAFNAMEHEAAAITWTDKERDLHRGVTSLNEGWFYGKGTRWPTWMKGTQPGVASRLRQNKSIKRVACFGSGEY